MQISVKRIPVIRTMVTYGRGTNEDPARVVTEYWDDDGKLLWMDDPCCKSDSYEMDDKRFDDKNQACARDYIVELVGERDAEILFDAVKCYIPIIVYERNTQKPVDGGLYRALKILGACEVYNYDLVMHREGKIHGVYCAYFHDGE